MPPLVAEKLHSLYLAKGALATTAIEGNTLTEEQVIDHLAGRLELPRSQEYLTQEIDNIVTACNGIVGQLKAGGPEDVEFDQVLRFNRQVLEGLEVSPEVVPGAIRTYSVGVGNYRGAPHEDCEYLLRQLCTWLNGPAFDLAPEFGLGAAILKAVVAHLYLAWIHPFGDGNGRTARLIEFKVLVASGVPTPAAHLLSNHYNLTRTRYYRLLDLSSRKAGGELGFVEYALEGFVEQLGEQIKRIRESQWSLAWRDYVLGLLEPGKGEVVARRHALVLALTDLGRPASIGEIAGLTPDLARRYVARTRKTIIRDLHELVSMRLVAEEKGRFLATPEVILAFLPWRKMQGVGG